MTIEFHPLQCESKPPTEGTPNEFDGRPPEAWTPKMRQSFAHFVHFGPGVLSRYTISYLLNHRLIQRQEDGFLVADINALQVWDDWVSRRKALSSKIHTQPPMKFLLV